MVAAAPGVLEINTASLLLLRTAPAKFRRTGTKLGRGSGQASSVERGECESVKKSSGGGRFIKARRGGRRSRAATWWAWRYRRLSSRVRA